MVRSNDKFAGRIGHNICNHFFADCVEWRGLAPQATATIRAGPTCIQVHKRGGPA